MISGGSLLWNAKLLPDLDQVRVTENVPISLEYRHIKGRIAVVLFSDLRERFTLFNLVPLLRIPLVLFVGHRFPPFC